MTGFSLRIRGQIAKVRYDLVNIDLPVCYAAKATAASATN